MARTETKNRRGLLATIFGYADSLAARASDTVLIVGRLAMGTILSERFCKARCAWCVQRKSGQSRGGVSGFLGTSRRDQRIYRRHYDYSRFGHALCSGAHRRLRNHCNGNCAPLLGICRTHKTLAGGTILQEPRNYRWSFVSVYLRGRAFLARCDTVEEEISTFRLCNVAVG